MKKSATILFTLFSFALLAQEEPINRFDAWDGNRDGVITPDEFTTIWDEEGYFNEWDTNGDGMLSEGEWRRSINEYRKTDGWKLNESRHFDTWDTDRDGQINESEFREGTFKTWDTDADRSIRPSEFHNYSNTLGSESMY